MREDLEKTGLFKNKNWIFKNLKIKKKLNLSIVVWSWSCCPIQNHILKKQNAIEVKINPFSCNQEYHWTNSIRNEYASTIIFQSLLFANIPVESMSYAPTFSFIHETTIDVNTFVSFRFRLTWKGGVNIEKKIMFKMIDI